MAKIRPNLDSVTTINEDGSRFFIHPSDVRGSFTLFRRLFALALVAVYVLLPWITINGFPAVFLDVANRRFHFFGLTLAAQNLWLGFFVITGVGFSLFYVTSLFGRLWCGWACPYTVFLEHVFRRVERWIDGDAMARRKLDDSAWTKVKIIKRVVKHTIYLLLSTIIAHVFLSYFVSLPRLWAMMHEAPATHWTSFGVVLFLTGALYFCFSWFREQFCIILCPYGRLQSALTDDNTMVIGYDKVRGEPRGKPGSEGVGDCIDCNRCVNVCPTGIDIRNGLQMECIGCAACVDACDEIMEKVHRPKGLVRYDSLNGLEGRKTKWIRPRTILYTVLLGAGAMALFFALGTIRPMEAILSRMPGMNPYTPTPGAVLNHFQLRVINKDHEARKFRIVLEGQKGARIMTDPGEVEIPAVGEIMIPLVVEIPRDDYNGTTRMQMSLRSEPGGLDLPRSFEFVGPDPDLYKKQFPLQP